MLVNQTVTFKKLTYFLGFSLVNIKSGWKLLKFSKNSSSFCPHFHSRQKRCRQFILAILRVSQSVFLQNQSQLYPWTYMRIVVQIWSLWQYQIFVIWLLNQIQRKNFNSNPKNFKSCIVRNTRVQAYNICCN